MFLKSDIPENYGISSGAILEFIDQAEAADDVNLINFMILSDENIIARFCKKPYAADYRQLLFSVTKSFTSIGAGIAIDKGYFNLDDKVIYFFPDKLPEVISENLSKMTVRHLLTMTTGIHDNTYGLLYPQKDWVKAFLAQELPHEPGTYYRYCTHASHMLSAIIEKTSGTSLLEFMNEHLFEPLDIPKPQWETCPMGIIAGGMGLSLAPESVAKFGVLLLNKGEYFGKRIISEDYINLATTAQVSKINNTDAINETDDRCTENYLGDQYGFQFHISLNGSFRAEGAFGQVCFIYPKERIILVATSRNTNTERLLQLIQTKLLNDINDNVRFEQSIHNSLQEKLAKMEFETPQFKEIPWDVPSLNNKCYDISENPNGVRQIMLNREGYQLKCRIDYYDGQYSNLRFDFTQPVCDKTTFVKDIQTHVQQYVSYAIWESSTVLELVAIFIETPYVVHCRISFIDDEIEIEFKMNVSLNLKNFTAVGRYL